MGTTSKFLERYGGATMPPPMAENPGTTQGFLDKYSKSEFTEYKLYNDSVTLRFEGGLVHKYYYVTGDELILVPSVTTVLGIWDKSQALMPWAARQACDKMRERLHTHINSGHSVQELSLETLEEWLSEAAKNYKATSQTALDVGKMAHDWLEQYIKLSLKGDTKGLDELTNNPPPNEAAHRCINAALAWMVKHQIKWVATEKKVFSKCYWYTGTTDGLCYFTSCTDLKCECANHPKYDNVLTLIDWKSSREIYDEYFQQEAAYKEASEEEYTAQKIGLMAVVRLGKDDGEFQFKLSDEEDSKVWFQGFLAALKGFNWKTELSEYKVHKRAKRKAAKVENKAAAKVATKKVKKEKVIQ